RGYGGGQQEAGQAADHRCAQGARNCARPQGLCRPVEPDLPQPQVCPARQDLLPHLLCPRPARRGRKAHQLLLYV
ncbi:hypothetical protein H4R23_002581, partial [Coemansia sp. Cherry 401B]